MNEENTVADVWLGHFTCAIHKLSRCPAGRRYITIQRHKQAVGTGRNGTLCFLTYTIHTKIKKLKLPQW